MTAKAKLLEKAQRLLIKGQFDKAVNEYVSVIAMDPSDAGIRMKVGDLYLKLSKKDDGLKQYIEVAKFYTEKGFYLKAIAVYKQILRLDPAAEVRLKLADLYARQKLIADAILEYSVVVAGLENRGRISDAMELVKKMVSLDQQNLALRLKVADYCRKLGFKEDAFKEYRLAFDMAEGQSNADAAERIYREVVAINGDEPLMLRTLSFLFKKKGDNLRFLSYAGQLANLYKERGEPGEARLVSEEMLAVNPGDNTARALLDSMGFRPLGTIEPSFAHEAEKAVIMEDVASEEIVPEINIVIGLEEEPLELLPEEPFEDLIKEQEEVVHAFEEPVAVEQEDMVIETELTVVEEPLEPLAQEPLEDLIKE
ncbi:MAG: tetratricopeptide repeat protein, partial [Deltaproteobacteria bacterium]|nr:tetratricopeptide repeat protein [Deltaproteobacteria bacterium]